MLLLDEPFGALDAKVRKDLRQWLRALHDEMKLTTIMVTHDQEEALALADRVAVMNEGRIEQVGRPSELIGKPAYAFVRDFLGQTAKASNAVARRRAISAKTRSILSRNRHRLDQRHHFRTWRQV